ncbi:hypothetical protein CJF42_24840 [Pseudoalteromonas sp. NBT06-2]|nr:hypothetical protein CJF42_24840 [Pseudoalteromonas sp. NBT06-2]
MKLKISTLLQATLALILGLLIYGMIYPSIVPIESGEVSPVALAWGAGLLILIFGIVQPWLRIIKILGWVSLIALLITLFV